MRLKPIISKEYGMWGILLYPFITTFVAVQDYNIQGLLFCVSALFFFLARYPAILLIKRNDFTDWVKSAQFFWGTLYITFSLTVFIFLVLYYQQYYLVIFANISVAILVINLVQVRTKSQRFILNEIIGIIGMTLSAPMLYYILTGSLHWMILVILWLFPALFFVGTIFFVKTQTTGKYYFLINFLYFLSLFMLSLLFAIAATEYYLLSIVFVPIGIQSLYSYMHQDQKIAIRKVGFILVFHGLVFSILLGYGLQG